MRLKISQETHTDLRDIARYTQSKWGKVQRRKYMALMNEAFQSLVTNPLLCVERKEFKPPVRIHHVGRHLIIYLQTDGGILIVRILHDNMDLDSRLS